MTQNFEICAESQKWLSWQGTYNQI